MSEFIQTDNPIHWREDAASNIDGFLNHGIYEIDKHFGKGYACDHPELLASYLKACADNLNQIQWSVLLQTAVSAIERAANAAQEYLDEKA